MFIPSLPVISAFIDYYLCLSIVLDLIYLRIFMFKTFTAEVCSIRVGSANKNTLATHPDEFDVVSYLQMLWHMLVIIKVSTTECGAHFEVGLSKLISLNWKGPYTSLIDTTFSSTVYNPIHGLHYLRDFSTKEVLGQLSRVPYKILFTKDSFSL